jgi:hypothetical protein
VTLRFDVRRGTDGGSAISFPQTEALVRVEQDQAIYGREGFVDGRFRGPNTLGRTPFCPSITSERKPAASQAFVTMQWMFYAGPEATLAEKIVGMKRFRKDLQLDG